MKMYHYFVSYVIFNKVTSSYNFGMADIAKSEKVTSFDDIDSFRESIAQKCHNIIKADDIFIISPQLIRDEPY